MKELSFTTQENRLSGPTHIAKIENDKIQAEFVIRYNIFTRNSFEVSFVANGKAKSLGQYVNCLEQAKTMCQAEWESHLASLGSQPQA